MSRAAMIGVIFLASCTAFGGRALIVEGASVQWVSNQTFSSEVVAKANRMIKVHRADIQVPSFFCGGGR